MELAFIKTRIAATTLPLQRLEKQITRLKEQLAQLKSERTRLYGYRVQHKSMLSPIRRMPTEVLGEIFAWASVVSDSSRLYDTQSTRTSWVLSHICHRWRAIALATPALWSLISIEYPSPCYQPQSLYPLSMVRAQIARAKTLKIHFRGNEDVAEQPQNEIFKCLVEHSSQWEELSIQLTSGLVPLLSGLRDRVASLRRLCIRWHNKESQEGVDVVSAFKAAPSLVDADIQNLYRHIPILLPAHQLTRYQIDAPWRTHITLLKLGQHTIVDACIIVTFDYEPFTESDSEDVIELPALRRVFLAPTTIAHYLRTPALEAVTSEITDDKDVEHLLSLTADTPPPVHLRKPFCPYSSYHHCHRTLHCRARLRQPL
ncbi:hypothetical protein C8R47DRAFT_149030 [Mycena vitilis]|nr:hypothetical protein C8R47DRAFT_443390 [Mycena vitilis]KAJ6458390.1 hypothetical protein C8R47DRAFT_149030 [Mycena vitilis]